MQRRMSCAAYDGEILVPILPVLQNWTLTYVRSCHPYLIHITMYRVQLPTKLVIVYVAKCKVYYVVLAPCGLVFRAKRPPLIGAEKRIGESPVVRGWTDSNDSPAPVVCVRKV